MVADTVAPEAATSKKIYTLINMPSSVLQPGLHSVEDGVWMGPKNTNYVDIVMTDDALRPQTTSRNNKYYADKPYDFPHLEIENPENRFLRWDPASTFAIYQSMSYAKRYPTDK